MVATNVMLNVASVLLSCCCRLCGKRLIDGDALLMVKCDPVFLLLSCYYCFNSIYSIPVMKEIMSDRLRFLISSGDT